MSISSLDNASWKDTILEGRKAGEGLYLSLTCLFFLPLIRRRALQGSSKQGVVNYLTTPYVKGCGLSFRPRPLIDTCKSMASVTVAVESPSPLLSPSPLVTSEPEAVDNGLKLMFNLWINWGFGKTEGLLLLISENPLAFTITLFVLALSCLLWYCCSCCCCCLRRQPERQGIN